MSDTTLLKPIHVLCPLGNPRSPRMWSGTTFHLTRVLESRGRLGVAEQVQVAKAWDFADRVGRWLLKEQDRRPGTSTVMHHARTWATQRRVRDLAEGHIIHIGTREFPWRNGQPKKRNHFLIDSTWRSWMAAQIGKLVSPNMAKALDERERQCLAQVDHIFCMGQYVKAGIERDYGIDADRVTAVGSGFGGITPYFGPKNYRNKKLLFVAKSNFVKKGGALVVEAVRRARQSDPDITLTLVGQESYPPQYTEWPWLQRLGRLPPGGDILQKLYDEHSMFLMPSQYDAWGIAYLEALACRMPIVGLDCNAFPEISGNGKYGFILHTQEPDEFARVLLDALSRPDDLARMGSEGQSFCLSHYTWDRMVDRMLAVIDAKGDR
ncbi:MAG: glycosyltransferase family 4 protein [bacterium]